MGPIPGIAADPGLDPQPLSKRGLWESNLDRLVEEVKQLKAEVERLRLLLLKGPIAAASSTTVFIQPNAGTMG